jgi:transcriptional regulator with XRE-family HTH domain
VRKGLKGDPDYAYGRLMLTLRTAIGLTQKRLANHLGVSRRAVGEWEVGKSYPKAEHLKAFIILAVKSQAFAAGHEAEEIRTLWKAAHQRVLLDERWLSVLLSEQYSPHPLAHPLVERTTAEPVQVQIQLTVLIAKEGVKGGKHFEATYTTQSLYLCLSLSRDCRASGPS